MRKFSCIWLKMQFDMQRVLIMRHDACTRERGMRTHSQMEI